MNSGMLVVKNTVREKTRLILLIFAIFSAFFLYGVLFTISTVGTEDQGSSSAARIITSNKTNFTQPLPISHFQDVETVDDIQATTHITWFGGSFRAPSNFVLASAVDPVSYLEVYPEIEISDRDRINFINDRTTILIGEELATRYGWVVGQQIPLISNIYSQKTGGRAWEFRIAGIYTSPTNATISNYALLHYDYLNDTRSFGVDTIGQIATLTNGAELNSQVSREIDALFDASFDPTDTLNESVYSALYLRQLGDIEFIITLVVGASFVSIMLMITNTMMITIRQREKELATMKSIGYSPTRIFGLIVGESLFVLFLGGMLGLGVGRQVIVWLASLGVLPGIDMPVRAWIGGVFMIFIVAFSTSVVPALKASRVNISAVFRRE